MKHYLFQILLFLTVLSCKSQDKTKALDTDELTKTSLTAMGFIKQNDYSNFKNLFAEDILKNIPSARGLVQPTPGFRINKI